MTLNTIKKQLIAFFEGHAQINQTVYSNDFDFAAQKDLLYPVAHIEYIQSAISGKKMTHNFQIKLADLSDPETPSVHDDVVSDMLQVAEDFFGWLFQHQDFEYSTSATIRNEEDAYGDVVSYISFPVTLSLLRSTDDCTKPSKN